MILLDTNAILWMLTGHARSAPLAVSRETLRLSPVSLLELKYLIEVGRLADPSGTALSQIRQDSRWRLDSPDSDRLFAAAVQVDWTRDPFDRLIVAHARCRRWRLATGDRHLVGRLTPRDVVAL